MSDARQRMFRQAASPGSHALAAADDSLEQALSSVAERARARLPGLPLDEPALVAHLARHMGDADDVVAALESCHAGDLWLACAAARGAAAALAVFEDEVLPGTRRIVEQLGVPPHVADDLMQDLRARLLLPRGERPPELLDYAGRGPLGAWLRVVAVREARRVLAARRREPGPGSDGLFDRLVQRSAETLVGDARVRYRTDLEAALRTAMGGLEPRERNLLRHQMVDELSVREIARLYNVHFATASRWASAARDRLLALFRAELVARLRLTAPEMDSLVRALRSEVDLSVERLLQD